LAHKGDNLHFTPAAYRTLGQRYAQKMLTLLPSCATSAPTVSASNISYEIGDVAKPLSVTGTSLKWYTVLTGGTAQTTAPTPVTSKVGATNYYVSQTANGCESPRTTITVTVSSTYKIAKTSTPIIIDGIVDNSWNNGTTLDIVPEKVVVGSVSGTNDIGCSIKALWDNTYLYVLANVTDQTLNNDSPNSYEDDAVEVYIDINNDKATAYGTNDVQYTFGWNDGATVGTLPSGRSSTGVTYTTVARTGGYILEAKIPWSTLSGSPAINQIIGLEFMVNDDDNGGNRDKKIAWTAATDDAYQNPSLFGVAKLADVPITTGFDNENVSFGSEIHCYPNPFSSTILVNTTGDFQYQFMNQVGQLLESGYANEKLTLSQEHPKGVYILKIYQNGKSGVFKLMKD